MHKDAVWQRWVPLTGILFVILLFIGAGFMDLSDSEDSDRDSHYLLLRQRQPS